MKKLSIYLLSTIALLASSCQGFMDINTDPDATTKVTPEMLATGIMLTSFKYSGDCKAYIGTSCLPKYVAYLNEGAYGPQYNQIGGGSFSTYSVWPNADDMVNYATQTVGITGYQEAFKGLALFIKAYNGYRMTMLMGDIPYSEAGKGLNGNTTPKYDSQADVFVSILADLEEAASFFDKATNILNGDIIFNGDVTKWAKAARAMQLKVINALGDKASATQIARFGTIVSQGGLMNGVDDNMTLKYNANSNSQHPMYNQPIFTPYTVISDIMVAELKKLNDRRLFYFADPAEKLTSEGAAQNDYSAYVGANPVEARESLGNKMLNKEFSKINSRYMSLQNGDPYLILTYAEQQLIIAEAIEKGWLNGNSQSYYESGVEGALMTVSQYDLNNQYNHQMPITVDYISGYFTGEAAFKATTADRLKQIWMQRYLINYLQDGTQAYWDFRKNGYPAFPNDPATSMNAGYTDRFPMRWTYPSSENQANHENYVSALTSQFGSENDITNSFMWLLK